MYYQLVNLYMRTDKSVKNCLFVYFFLLAFTLTLFFKVKSYNKEIG